MKPLTTETSLASATDDMDITRQKLIFITGASRSGTTLLSFVLRNHDQVMGLKELQYFGEFWDPRRGSIPMPRNRAIQAAATMLARQQDGVLAGKPDAGHMEQAATIVDGLGEDGSDPAALFAETVAEISKRDGKSIPCEQTPRNIYYARALLDLYPNCRIVHMMRDPRAVMASQKQRWQRRSLTTDTTHFPRSRTFRAWVNYHPFTISQLWNRSARQAKALRDHSRFHIVRFEDLLSAPEHTIQSMCEFIGLDFQEAMLDIGQVNSSHESSKGGAQSGFNPKAIDAWRNKLSAAEVQATEQRCGELMSDFYYAATPGSRSGIFRRLWMRVTYLFHLAGVVLLNPRRAWIQFRGLLSGQRSSTPPAEQRHVG